MSNYKRGEREKLPGSGNKNKTKENKPKPPKTPTKNPKQTNKNQTKKKKKRSFGALLCLERMGRKKVSEAAIYFFSQFIKLIRKQWL